MCYKTEYIILVGEHEVTLWADTFEKIFRNAVIADGTKIEFDEDIIEINNVIFKN